MAHEPSSAPELRRFLAQVFVPLCLLIVATTTALMATQLWSAREANRMAAQASQDLAQTGYRLALDRVGSNVAATAIWDDAVLQVHNHMDRAWAVENIGDWATDSLHFEMTFILGPDDVTRFAMIDGRASSASARSIFDGGLQGLIDRVRATPLGEPATGLARAGDRLAIVGVAAIRPHTDKLMPISGGYSVLVYADALDAAAIESMQQAYLLDDLKLVNEKPGDGEAAIPLSANGRSVAYLTWTPPRPGTRLLSVGLPVLGTVVVAIAMLAVVIYFYAQRAAAALSLSRQLALTDILTGLPNRLLLMDRLRQAMSGAERSNGMVAAFCLDLDGLKRVNDTYGHASGDQLLQEVAQRFQSAIRPADTVARFGGGEFVIVQPAADERSIRAVADRLLQSLNAPILLNGASVSIGVSIGVAVSDGDSERPLELLRRADTALYEAKRAGKGQWQLAEPPPTSRQPDSRTEVVGRAQASRTAA